MHKEMHVARPSRHVETDGGLLCRMHKNFLKARGISLNKSMPRKPVTKSGMSKRASVSLHSSLSSSFTHLYCLKYQLTFTMPRSDTSRFQGRSEFDRLSCIVASDWTATEWQLLSRAVYSPAAMFVLRLSLEAMGPLHLNLVIS
ncbi:hypothetical protein D918_00669 [Trichuris suis]|nr:hypothetical protein D918_00669 [Trichuris suis]